MPIATIGTLPKARASSVNVLRAKPRDNETYTFDLQITPLAFTLTAGGVLKQRFQFQTGAVQLLANLMACFEEIRFSGVRLYPKTTTFFANPATPAYAQGYMKMWIDDAILSTAVPTYTDAFSRQTVDVPLDKDAATNVARQQLQWVATDLEDSDWVSIPTGTPTSFCPFTVAVFAGPGVIPGASSGTATNSADQYTTVLLDGAVRVQMRTLRSA